MPIQKITRWFAVLLVSLTVSVQAQQPGLNSQIDKTTDISYAMVDGHDLKLDLYMPDGVSNPPLLVYIHGGAWRGGSKAGNPINTLANSFGADGYAVASLEFRMSGDAMFPAQIHDIKAGIRFLRANEGRFGYDSSKIGILGSSSGGHLVAMMGVSNGHEVLEGKVGDNLNQSSDVQAVVSYYGASNLNSILNQSTPRGLSVRVPALDLLIGGQPEDQASLADLASPVVHVNSNSAPLLLLHGDQDPQMPINQSHELHHAYKQNSVTVQFEVVHGAAHGGAAFYDAKSNALVSSFLNKQLR